MKLAIVNDLNLAIEALRRVLAYAPEYEIVWVAKDGAEAVEQCHKVRPDIILMDLIMPVMDGVEATRRIMMQAPCAILIVTATVEGNSSKVYEAMSHGALDAVATPTLDLAGGVDGGDALLRKINLISTLIRQPAGTTPAETCRAVARSSMATHPLLVIGASTGGPQAIADILSKLPKDFSAAIALVQHVDQQFAPGLATWLHERCHFPVRTIHPGDELVPGQVLIAATNDHLVLKNNFTLAYTPHPKASPYRPSIDVFFQSIAHLWRGKGCAVLLTGMGRDGAEGLLALRHAAFHTIAQDRASSIVYGMPKAAAELNAAEKVLPLPLIADAVRGYFEPKAS